MQARFVAKLDCVEKQTRLASNERGQIGAFGVIIPFAKFDQRFARGCNLLCELLAAGGVGVFEPALDECGAYHLDVGCIFVVELRARACPSFQLESVRRNRFRTCATVVKKLGSRRSCCQSPRCEEQLAPRPACTSSIPEVRNRSQSGGSCSIPPTTGFGVLITAIGSATGSPSAESWSISAANRSRSTARSTPAANCSANQRTRRCPTSALPTNFRKRLETRRARRRLRSLAPVQLRTGCSPR